MQRWKSNKTLYNCPTVKDGNQIKKMLDYSTTYKNQFLEQDPIRDWESFERCKFLWNWALKQIVDVDDVKKVLDCGTKDCKFPSYLCEQGYDAMGLEYSDVYVEYAKSKNRPVIKGDACHMEFEDNSFDFVFSHHMLGLVEDNVNALKEMFRVTNRYMVCLTSCPGNPKKHFSYIESPKFFNDFVKSIDCKIICNNYLPDTGFSNEWVLLLKKKG